MSNTEIIEDIRQNFEELNNRKDNNRVKALIHTTARLIGRIKTGDKKLAYRLTKIASDLNSSGISEEQLYKLNNPGSTKISYSEGFYTSVNILKDELFSLFYNFKD